MVLTGQRYPHLERVHMQGHLSAMWGLAGVLGPTLGGLFTQWISWCLLFLLNVPLGLLAVWFGMATTVHPPSAGPRPQIDWVGAGLLGAWLTAGLSAITVFQQNPQAATGWLLMVLVVPLGLGLWAVERRAVSPLIPVAWLTSAFISVPSALALAASGTLYACVVVIPLWLHYTWHLSPFAIGMSVLPLPVGWALGSMLTPQILTRISLRNTARAAIMAMSVGLLLFQSTGNATSTQYIVLGNFALGCGVGILIMATLNSVQSSVSTQTLGSATGLYNLGRNLGNTAGPGIIGGLVLLLWHTSVTGSKPGILSTVSLHQVLWGVLALFAVMSLLVQGLGRLPMEQAHLVR